MSTKLPPDIWDAVRNVARTQQAFGRIEKSDTDAMLDGAFVCGAALHELEAAILKHLPPETERAVRPLCEHADCCEAKECRHPRNCLGVLRYRREAAAE